MIKEGVSWSGGVLSQPPILRATRLLATFRVTHVWVSGVPPPGAERDTARVAQRTHV
jgi:hypothetical protein